MQVTEAEVAQHFATCGQIMDCRVCGDPNSAMRFAFIEFKEEASVMKVGVRIPLLHRSVCTVMAPIAGWETQSQEYCCTVGSAAELVPAWQPSPARDTLQDGHCTSQERLPAAHQGGARPVRPHSLRGQYRQEGGQGGRAGVL